MGEVVLLLHPAEASVSNCRTTRSVVVHGASHVPAVCAVASARTRHSATPSAESAARMEKKAWGLSDSRQRLARAHAVTEESRPACAPGKAPYAFGSELSVRRNPSMACSAQRLMNQRPTVLSNSPYRKVGASIPISMSTKVPP